ncbi:MAG: TIGR00266 family protein [Clostridiales bacterium]|nr:TIGR00266 family protein [Clostridiales bacterium]
MNYQITGTPFPTVACTLEDGEAMICEKGSMCWKSPNVEMSTTSNGGIGKVFSRMFSGESLFQNIFTARGGGQISFASSFPGDIVKLDIQPGKEAIVQKSSFLASTMGVELSIYFQKKFGKGLFGGEGFIMQKLSGNGTAFIEIDGSATQYELAPGQSIIVDTGHLVMMDSTCSMDIERIRGAKNIFFGGQGLFNTVVTGPGKVVLQSMPIYKLAQTLIPFMPEQTNTSVSVD